MNRINTIIIVAITLFIIPFIALATDGYDYYYSGGKKIFLKRNPDKICVLTPKTNNSILLQQIDNKIYPNSSFDIIVKKLNDTITSHYFDINSEIMAPCYVDNYGNDIVPTNGIYIKLKDRSDYNILKSVSDKWGLKIVRQNKYLPLWYTLTITPESRKNSIEIANTIYETGLFKNCEPSFIYTIEDISWDLDISYQWGLHNSTRENIDINASSAWNIATGKGIKIGVIEGGGIETSHCDLFENIYPLCYDAELDIQQIAPNKYEDHATFVAGIISATRNNGIGISGVAPDAKLISVRTSYGTDFDSEYKALGILWACINGADILNCSWGTQYSDLLQDAINYVLTYGRNGKGCILVKSAGNTSSVVEEDGEIIKIQGEFTYPAGSIDNILVVGSCSRNGYRATDSAYGNALDVVAPGVTIYSIRTNNNFSHGSGTSAAAPHVAGLAALILERNPDLTGQQVRDIIEQNTIKIGSQEYTIVDGRPNGTWNEEYGYGLIDAYKALLATPKKEENY